MFCKECGRNISEHRICPYCRSLQSAGAPPEFIDIKSQNFSITPRGKHSYVIAGFLQIFLGAFGVGRFYLGYKGMGFLQILSSVISFGTGGVIWGIIDGFMILNGREKYDAEGKLLI